MKTLFKTSILLPLFLIVFNFSAKASHIAGGEITYTCLGNNQYRIYLNLFVDCAGFNPGSSQTINFSSTCGQSTTASVQATAATTNGLEISQLCASSLPNSTCNGGNLPGMWLFAYEGTVTLAPPCNTWKMSWSTCCRNSAVTNLTTSSSSYWIEATLNSTNAPCNSSPKFNAQPIPYVCTNQPVNYSYGVTEPDGDSLYYQLTPALTTASNASATYNTPYSGTSPIPGITINAQTGLVSFTPSSLGNFVVVIKVTEYNRATQLVLGTVMRDIQFVVMNCVNTVPLPTGGAIANLTGTALQTGPYALDMCVGSTFNFDAVYTDPNITDVLTFVSNITTALPGATVTQVGASTNPLTLNFAWTAPASAQGTNPTFTITVSDGACPIVGQQTFVYAINILNATATRSDTANCGAKPVPLSATGGTIFTWSVISGDPITPANFSCNPCSSPIATPSVTTTYMVTSNLSGTCKNTDTVKITVYSQPVALYNAEPQPATVLNPTINFSNISTGQVDYITWDFGLYGTSTSQSPSITYPDTGSYPVQLIVSNIYGCTDTIDGHVTVNPIAVFFAPNAFTPNNNGLNDSFMVKADGIDRSTFEMLIFNRWGEIVFKSNNIYHGWSGTKNNSGIIQDSDVYVWKVKYKDYSGLENSRIGHVTLLR